jgi:hypothetical protein
MPLVLSPGLVATPPLDFAAHYPIIGWHNLVTVSNLEVEHEDTDHPGVNMANPATFLKWLSDDANAQTWTVTLAGEEIDYVGLEGHNLGSLGATVLVEVLAPGDGEVYEEVHEVSPGTDATLILRFGAQNAAGLKVTITPPEGGYGEGEFPQNAVLHVGKLLTMQKGLQMGHTPIVDGDVVEILNGTSQGGDFLGSIVTFEAKKSGAQFKLIDKTWFRSDMRPFLVHANGGQPFFWAWNPDGFPEECGYCWLDGPARPTISHTAGHVDLQLEMTGIAE